jgi:hypothetical protein
VVGAENAVKKVPPKLAAKRVKKTWVLDTTFSLLSGAAKLELTVTQDGSLTPLQFLKGSKLGDVVAKKAAKSLTVNAKKAGAFPIKLILPAKGISPTRNYVVRITATAPSGAASRLDLGFRGVKLLKKRASLKLAGDTLVASSTFAVPKEKKPFPVTAWVAKDKSTARLQMLEGSRLGRTIAKSARRGLAFKATKKGSYPVQIVLPLEGLSPDLVYVISVDSRPKNAAWTTFEIRFRASKELIDQATRGVAGADNTGPTKSAKK